MARSISWNESKTMQTGYQPENAEPDVGRGILDAPLWQIGLCGGASGMPRPTTENRLIKQALNNKITY